MAKLTTVKRVDRNYFLLNHSAGLQSLCLGFHYALGSLARVALHSLNETSATIRVNALLHEDVLEILGEDYSRVVLHDVRQSAANGFTRFKFNRLNPNSHITLGEENVLYTSCVNGGTIVFGGLTQYVVNCFKKTLADYHAGMRNIEIRVQSPDVVTAQLQL